MDDGEAAGDQFHQAGGFFFRKRALFLESLRQAAAGHQLHANVRAPVAVADLVDVDDGRVIQFAEVQRLAVETLPIAGAGAVEHLNRHVTRGGDLPGQEDFAGAALAKSVEDLIAGDHRKRLDRRRDRHRTGSAFRPGLVGGEPMGGRNIGRHSQNAVIVVPADRGITRRTRRPRDGGVR